MTNPHPILEPPKICRAGVDPHAEQRRRFKTFCFFPDEFEDIFSVWGPLGIESINHDRDRLRLTLANGARVSINNDTVTWENAPDREGELCEYAALHAKAFWGGRTELHGTEIFKAISWAYCQAHGVTVTNYTPKGPYLQRANRLLAAIEGGKPSRPLDGALAAVARQGKPSGLER